MASRASARSNRAHSPPKPSNSFSSVSPSAVSSSSPSPSSSPGADFSSPSPSPSPSASSSFGDASPGWSNASPTPVVRDRMNASAAASPTPSSPPFAPSFTSALLTSPISPSSPSSHARSPANAPPKFTPGCAHIAARTAFRPPKRSSATRPAGESRASDRHAPAAADTTLRSSGKVRIVNNRSSTPPWARNWSSCWCVSAWKASSADQTSAHADAACALHPASISASISVQRELCCSMSVASSIAARRSSRRSRTPVNDRLVPPGVWLGGKCPRRRARASSSRVVVRSSSRPFGADSLLFLAASASRMASTTSCPGEGRGGRAGLAGGVFLTAMGGGGGGRFAPTERRVGAASSATGIARVFLGTFPGPAPASPSLLGPGAPRALGVDARRRAAALLSSPSPRPRISWRKNDIPSFLRGPRRK